MHWMGQMRKPKEAEPMKEIQRATQAARERTGHKLLAVRVEKGRAQICNHYKNGRFYEAAPLTEWFPAHETLTRLESFGLSPESEA